MSWDACLIDDRGHYEGDWNFTHNCNNMANAVLYDDYEPRSVFAEVFAPTSESWWSLLDGMSGPTGAALLGRIVDGLRSDPDRFRKMELGNGCGDYDSFVDILDEMRRAVPEWPTTWSVSG